MRTPDYTRRVVVTGLGVISPVGNDVATAWGSLVNGVSGLGPITRFDPTPYEAKLAGEVHDFNAADWMDAKAARRSESSMHFGVAAAKQALADSGFEITDENRTEVGVVFGSGAGGQQMMIDNYASMKERGPRSLIDVKLSSIICCPPAPEPKTTPTSVRFSSVISKPESARACLAAATPKCMLASLRRAALASIQSLATKSWTSPPSLASYGVVSKRVIGPRPETPFRRLVQAVLASLPTELMTPRPVTTTRRS